MAEKVSTLLLNVDLQCPRCYKKVKKTLSKFPEIRDQIFDEKKNTVKITGFFCPHKLAKKLCCKGGIKSIEIIEPEKPKPKPADPKPDNPPVVVVKPPTPKKAADPPKAAEPAPKAAEPKPKAAEPKPKEPEPIPVAYPPAQPIGTCCGPCSQGYGGGPCFQGYGWPFSGFDDDYYGRPLPCYDDGYRRPLPCYDDGYRRNTGHGSGCDYFSDENPTCIIM